MTAPIPDDAKGVWADRLPSWLRAPMRQLRGAPNYTGPSRIDGYTPAPPA